MCSAWESWNTVIEHQSGAISGHEKTRNLECYKCRVYSSESTPAWMVGIPQRDCPLLIPSVNLFLMRWKALSRDYFHCIMLILGGWKMIQWFSPTLIAVRRGSWLGAWVAFHYTPLHHSLSRAVFHACSVRHEKWEVLVQANKYIIQILNRS